MKILLFLILCFVNSNFTMAADEIKTVSAEIKTVSAEIKTVSILTPEWKNYTEYSGKGHYHELFKMLFEPIGLKIDIGYCPFKRCLKELVQKRGDLVPATYHDLTQNLIYPKWHMNTDIIYLVYQKKTIPEWKGQQSLINKKVGWFRGYDFDKFGVIRVIVEKNEFDRLSSALRMLERGRLDAVADYRDEIEATMKKVNLNPSLFQGVNIPGKKLYMSFVNSRRGKKLAKIYDQRMDTLYQSGELQQWFSKMMDDPNAKIGLPK